MLWQGDKIIDLGTLGGSGGVAYAISNNGVIAGRALVPGDFAHAFTWRNGVLNDLGTLGGPNSIAWAVNDNGVAVGYSLNANHAHRAAIWQNGGGADLMPQGTNRRVNAREINSAEDIVGWTDLGATLWSNNTITILDSFPGGGRGGAYAINDRGQIVGRSDVGVNTGRAHAALWDSGRIIDLGTLGGDCE